MATLPADGEYELIVGGTQTGSYQFQIDEVNPTALTLGTPFAGTLPAGGFAQLFRVPVAETQALSIVLDAAASAGHDELYARIGSPPTRSDYQFASTTAGSVDQSLLVPAAAPGDWFILVYGESVPQPAGFTLLARAADVFVNSVTPHALPRAVGAPGGNIVPPVDLVIEGSGFRDVTKVEIFDARGVVATAQAVKVDSSHWIRASFLPTKTSANSVATCFPFLGNDHGPLSVRVTNRDGSVGVLANAIALLPEASGALADTQTHTVILSTLETDLILPDVLLPFGVATLTVVYANTGLLPMPAPILVVRLDDPDHPDLKPIMTLDASIVPTGFLTSAIPAGFSDTVQVLATGRVPGILEPGERGEVPVYLVGFSGTIPFHQTIQFALGVIRGDQGSNFIVDWPSSKDALRPPGIDPEAWDAIFENYQARVGNSASDYVGMLDSNSTYLSGIGEDVTDVHDLNAFVLAQADGQHPVRTLATTDASVPAPGLDLELTRTFPNTISTGFRRGVLGRGWYHSWETSLAVEPDGTVNVSTPDGVQRRFEPVRRPFRQASYFAAPGDHGSLTRLADGSFDLREADGRLQHFGADGKLAFVEDLNGNRITATYTGDLLTRLEHSSGQFLDLAYNAAGRLQTVTDSDGRVVHYSYDAANEHLVQFTDYDGRVTHYSYTDGADIQKRHALASIVAPRASPAISPTTIRGATSAHFSTTVRIESTIGSARPAK